MRIAVLSDIHANEIALQAVLEDAEHQRVEQFWCLGDIVGYGPDPKEPVHWAMEMTQASPDNLKWVMGNHEEYLAYLLGESHQPPWMNNYQLANNADRALRFHQAEIESTPEKTFLQGAFREDELFRFKLQSMDGIDYILAHASLVEGKHTVRGVYPWQRFSLSEEFEELQKMGDQEGQHILLIGHTHVPLLAKKALDSDKITSEYVEPDTPYHLNTELVIINPGSVGLPRDLDRRASYAILDTEDHTLVFRRIDYDLREVISRLQNRGLAFEGLLHPNLPGQPPPEWRRHFERWLDNERGRSL